MLSSGTLHTDESVFAVSLNGKSGKFSKAQGEADQSSPCLIFRAFCTVYHTGVGYCLFVQGFTRASIQIDGIAPHFLFIMNIYSWGGNTGNNLVGVFLNELCINLKLIFGGCL